MFECLSEAERNRSIEAGDPIVLHCEVSNPDAEVCWFRNGEPLSPQDGIEIKTNGNMRMLIIQSADYYDSGTYSCQSADDVAVFQVDITGDRKPTIQICVCLCFPPFSPSNSLLFPFLRCKNSVNLQHHNENHLFVTTNLINFFFNTQCLLFPFPFYFLNMSQTFGAHLLPRHDIFINGIKSMSTFLGHAFPCLSGILFSLCNTMSEKILIR